ncbi:hypothetical protein DICPUDRAFT_48138 [Dictyostelium purpureum]|uniref:NECAP PHear domain-containing protein n=1 Tax=Dictyostelium purpureum TaxID=5786 RepID=F0ZN00_DICPU|nr:uncharacterized protein DICPUDRAFT_48138 [Dictyostelium purpureum]EGC34656.1 hypothetical protein DICPUDRAFT_48138 [Dictyostelium purpureum]|eukprot:XP_003288793.1 hypothetical protein DICPUDRAFT_48138 [Dictyostelium purpureum]
MEEDHEQTLLIKKECFIYRIPPRPSAQGYKAQDWDPSTYIWSGRLVIVARGDLCVIRFEDPNSGEIFAQCPVDSTAVEPVVDSSRYFVIKIKDGERHAFVGMGFTDRSDAFDFSATLQDHQNYVKNKKDIEVQKKKYENEPKKDYSLKTGQTIHIPFKAPVKNAPQQQQNKIAVVTGAGGGFLLSPPPPAGSKGVRPIVQQSGSQQNDFFSSPQQQQPQQQQQSNNFFNQPQQQQQQPQHSQNNNIDPFGNFGNSNDFFSSPQQNNNNFNNNNSNNNFFNPQPQQNNSNNNNDFWFN